MIFSDPSGMVGRMCVYPQIKADNMLRVNSYISHACVLTCDIN